MLSLIVPVYASEDLPIRLALASGALALLITFFGGLTTFSLGVVGQYVWLTLQSARQRPNYVVRSVKTYSR